MTLAILMAAAPVSAASDQSLVMTVYSNGYVWISQTIPVDHSSVSVQIPLVAATVSDLVATDQNGSPLSYSFGSGGRNVTIYTLGATEVALTYDTDNLTSKSGTVWSFGFAVLYNSTVVLPDHSTLVSVSGTPYTINETDGTPELTLAPGVWTIDYGVPFSVSSVTTGTSASSTGSSFTSGAQGSLVSPDEVVGLALATAAIVSGLFYFWWKRRQKATSVGELRPDDIRVLDFIREKGGRVIEPEVRMKFALPKTSAWRQIKRLERLGYVKVAKIGSQNQIELLKERNLDS